ncbi:hypothetical protein DIPPA_03198 [Diplonema papillatum]|nr:hypothetical protein DIPPA_03198 [Diplonema papillatum]
MGKQQLLCFTLVGFLIGYLTSQSNIVLPPVRRVASFVQFPARTESPHEQRLAPTQPGAVTQPEAPVPVPTQPGALTQPEAPVPVPTQPGALAKPLTFNANVKAWSCAAELPPGEARCQHSVPSIAKVLRKTTTGDLCSWWSGVVGRGNIPPKRLGVKAGNIPPRSFCTSDRVCVHQQLLCLGHTPPVGLEPHELAFCPHHDGPSVIELTECPKEVSCNARSTFFQPNMSLANIAGAGRNIISIQHRWLGDGGNIWHWVTSLLDVFGAVVEADPSLLDATGSFRKTGARISIMVLTGAFHKDRKLYQMGGRKGWRAQWGPRAPQSRGFLEQLSVLPVQYVDPEVDQCFENVVMGTPMETYLQWEDAAFSPRQQFRMTAYAQFLIRVALGTLGKADGAKKAPLLPIAAPWSAVYEARKKPRLLVMTRGEDQKPYSPGDERTRLMMGFEILEPTARILGFDITFSQPTSTLAAQVMAAASADVILGVHGAALAWAIVLPAHGVLVEMRTQLRLVDRAFIYPQLCSSRGLTYLVWTPSHPVIPAKDQRLPFDTFFNITDEAALFHLTLAKRELLDKAPFLDETGAQQIPG